LTAFTGVKIASDLSPFQGSACTSLSQINGNCRSLELDCRSVSVVSASVQQLKRILYVRGVSADEELHKNHTSNLPITMFLTVPYCLWWLLSPKHCTVMSHATNLMHSMTVICSGPQNNHNRRGSNADADNSTADIVTCKRVLKNWNAKMDFNFGLTSFGTLCTFL